MSYSTGYVYFIAVGGYFKVGFSEDPRRRFERLHLSGTRYTFPADASLRVEDRELYKVIEGWKDVERVVHQALDNYAVGLEWFLDEPPVREFVDSLPLIADNLRDLPVVERAGDWCGEDYRRVQAGRAEREVARYMARRAS